MDTYSPLVVSQLGFAVVKSKSKFVAKLNEAIEKRNADGSLKRIAEKWDVR